MSLVSEVGGLFEWFISEKTAKRKKAVKAND